MPREGQWGPTGVVPRGHATTALSDERWCQVQLIVKERTARSAPNAFRADLDRALQAHDTIKYLHARGSPKPVKQNLKRALETALRLNDRLNELDGNSLQILSEVPDGNIWQLRCRVRGIILSLAQADSLARRLPKTKAGLRNFAPLNLGQFLALAIDWHFGTKHISSSHNGLFAQLYAVLAKQLRISSNHKAIRAALKFWKDETQPETFRASEEGSVGKNSSKFSS
jgi:hypothetical protein